MFMEILYSWFVGNIVRAGMHLDIQIPGLELYKRLVHLTTRNIVPPYLYTQ